MFLSRRDFVCFAGSPLLARSLAPFAPQTSRRDRVPVIDGMGEIRIDYEPALLDEIRASGINCCVITLGNPALHGQEALDDVLAELLKYEKHIEQNRDRLSKVQSVADVEAAQQQGTIGLIYYIQNATPLKDNLEGLVLLKRLGIRSIQLTYNSRNLLGDGCLERVDAGLSHFGVEVVQRMNELNLLVDLSHCGPATSADAIKVSRKPASINHSGCRTVFDHPRNKSDDLLRAMADRGGVIGIFQINPYIGAAERNTLEQYMAHIDHAVKVAGIDHVGIGSDREHRVIPDTAEEKQKLIDELSRLRPLTASTFRWPFFIAELNQPRRMETLSDALQKRGYTGSQRDKILGANFLRLFRETMG